MIADQKQMADRDVSLMRRAQPALLASCSALALLVSAGTLAQQSNIVPKSHVGPPPPASCPQGSSFADGCAEAAPAAKPLVGALRRYVLRPPWNVAGVDYGTGVPTGTKLTDVTMATLPSGCRYSNFVVTCSSETPTLNALDFSQHNGSELIITGGTVTLTNSLFRVGSNQGSHGTVLAMSGHSNLVASNSEFDGNHVAVIPHVGSTVSLRNTGTEVFNYNYFHDSGGDIVDIGPGIHTDNFHYNVFENFGENTGHADSIQHYHATVVNDDWGFNTVYTNIQMPGPGLGILTYQNGIEHGSGVAIHNNTLMVLQPGSGCSEIGGNFVTGYQNDDPGDTNGRLTNNYIDPTGALCFTGMWLFPNGYYAKEGYFAQPMAIANNWNMVTGTKYTTYPVAGRYFVVPDAAGYTPPLSDIWSVTTSPASGNVTTGNTVTITFNMDEAWTVVGVPAMTLNSGGSASYASGNGTATLNFKYTVRPGDSANPLAVTALNLPRGAAVRDSVGNSANLTAPAQAFRGLTINAGMGSCPRGNALPDGCPGAQSSGRWQVPNFFTGYTSVSYRYRPAWNVAGVDYPVGYAGSLSDAATATLPACASRSGSGSGPFSITVNSAPCTLSHLDFSLHEGICVTDNASGSGTVTFDNDKFGYGRNCNANGGSLLILSGSAPVVIQYTEFVGAQTSADLLEALVQTRDPGPSRVTVHYSAFINTDQADIQLNAPTILNVSFNYVEGIACCGNHGDWVIPNWSGTGAYNDSFNTVYTGRTSGITTLCYITARNGVGAISGSCKNDVLVANGHPGQSGYLVETDAVAVNAFDVSNNWMDPTGTYGYFADQPGSRFTGPITCYGNKSLITGATATGTIAGRTCN